MMTTVRKQDKAMPEEMAGEYYLCQEDTGIDIVSHFKSMRPDVVRVESVRDEIVSDIIAELSTTCQGLFDMNVGLKSDVQDLLNQLVASVNALSEGMVVKHELGASTSGQISDVMKSIVAIALGASAIVYVHEQEYFLGLLSALAVLFLKHGAIKEAVCKFATAVANVTQSGDMDFGPLLGLAMAALGVSKLATGKVKDFTSVAANYPKVVDGTSDMFSNALRITEMVINYIRENCFGMDKIKFFVDTTDEIQEWCDDIDEISELHVNGKYLIDSENYQTVLLLKSIGERYLKEAIKGGKELVSVKSIVQMYMRKLSEIFDVFKKASLDNSCLRPPPLAILLQGESGVGKSAVTIPLIDHMIIGTMNDASSLRRYQNNNMDFVYSRTYETKFWDGYRGQMVCVFDDFMQNVESTNDPDGEPMNIIRAVNPFPYQLHMAHLEDKGNNYFNSSIILATTNDYHLNSLTIKKPEALKRRFEIIIEVAPYPEYCVDPSVEFRERRLKNLGEFSLDVYEFRVTRDAMGILGSKGRPTSMGFYDLVAFLCEAVEMKKNNGTKYISTIGSMRKDLVAQRLARLEGLATVLQSGDAQSSIRWDAIFNLVFRWVGSMYPDGFWENFFLSTYWAAAIRDLEMDIRAFGVVEGSSASNIPFRLRRRCFTRMANAFGHYCNEAGVISVFTPSFREIIFGKHWFFIENGREPDGAAVTLSEAGLVDHEAVFFYGTNLRGSKYTPSRLCRGGCVMSQLRLALEDLDSFRAYVEDVGFERAITRYVAADGENCRCCHWAMACNIAESKLSSTSLRIQSVIKKALDRVMNHELTPIVKRTLTVLAVIKAVTMIPRIWTYAFGKKQKKVLSTRSQYGEPKTNVGVRPLKSFRVAQIKAQDGDSENIPDKKLNFIRSVMHRNVYVMYIDGHDETPWGYLTALGSDIFMMNAHYYRTLLRRVMLNKKVDITVVPYSNVCRGDHSVVYHINPYNIMSQYPPSEDMLNSDCWLFRLSNMRPHRYIVDSFMTSKRLTEYGRVVDIAASFCRWEPDLDEVLGVVYRAKAEIVESRLEAENLSLRHYLRYEFPSEDGDCGSLVFASGASEQDLILGMHAAIQQGKHALSTVVSRDAIKKWYDEMLTRDIACVLPEKVDPVMDFDRNGIIQISSPHTYHRPTKSKLRRSPLFGLFGTPSRLPAVLTATDGTDPYDLAIERYGTGNFHVDSRFLNAAVSSYNAKILRIAPKNPTLLTFDEAVAGIAGEPYIKGVCRSTSPGYPWNLNGNGGKWHIFGDAQVYDLSSENCEKLRDRVMFCIEEAKQGRRQEHYYIDALKDELRPLDKVEGLKTRMISCAPLDLVILFKMYFGRFVSEFIENRLYNGSAVGINPVSGEWDTLGRKLLTKGDAVVAGDFSSFDATQSTTTLKAILKIINNWYNDGSENALVREILWAEVYNSLHLHGKTALMFDHSLPSGNPLTTIINTMYVNIVVRMAFAECMNNPAALSEFDRHVELIAYGDDNIMNISDEAIEYFNYRTIPRAMEKFGLIYTSEDKSEVESGPICKTLLDATFLKRSFVRTTMGFIGPLDINTVVEMPYWYRQGPGVEQRIEDNVSNCLCELSLHGDEKWDEYAPKLIAKCRDLDIIVEFEDRDVYLDLVVSKYLDDELVPQCGFGAVVAQSGVISDAHDEAQTSEKLEERADLTVFKTDAPVREFDPISITGLDTKLLNLSHVYNQDMVKQFLARPIQIDTFNFSSTAAAGDLLYQHVLPANDFYHSVSSLWQHKLAGFLGIRATGVFRFVLAANRFVQGRLIAHYLPGLPDSTWNSSHNFNLTTITQQPRIDININRDTASSIKFPYISPSTHYNLFNHEGKWGTMFVHCYSPLLGIVGNIEIGVFLHFEDIDLAIPTYVEPQSGKFRDYEGSAPISGTLGALGDASRSLARIPLLSTVATRSAWVFSALSRTAKAFGFAAGVNTDNLMRVSNIDNPYLVTGDGQRAAQPAGNSSKNCVSVLPGFAGVDVDEMSIEYIASRPAYVDTFDLSTSNVAGDVIKGFGVGPSDFDVAYSHWNAPAAVAGTLRTMPPFTLLSKMTGYWRGSITFTIKLVKTEFHTGKIAVAYFPGLVSNQSFERSNWTFRQVLDIKSSDEFHITLPYTSLTPWKQYKEVMGRFVIYVVNPLNAPATVSNYIKCLVEVCGGPDFAVAGHSSWMAAPALYTMEEGIRVQSGMFSDDVRVETFTIGDCSIPDRSVEAEEFCIGEAILSIRNLVTKLTRVIGLAVANNANTTTARIMAFRPCTFAGVTAPNTLNPIVNPLAGTYFDVFAACFTLVRGSMLHNVRMENGALFTDVSLRIDSDILTASDMYMVTGSTGASRNYPNNSQVVSSQFQGTGRQNILIHTPQWSKAHSRYSRFTPNNLTRVTREFEPKQEVVLGANNTTINEARYNIYRGAGDDVSFGGFVGVPLIYSFETSGGELAFPYWTS